jgi:Asp/Glu/hydantoin racemase
MPGPILVINPNSNEAVTEGLRAALAPFQAAVSAAALAIDCVTLAEGPFGIESQRDSDSVVMPLARLVEARSDASAFVIACYSDPGLDVCRSVARAPVYGIQESGVATALARVDLFGVIAIAEASILRHRRAMRRMGVLDRLAGERALGVSVDESARGAQTFDRLTDVGAALIGDGAQALVLGCAGMAVHRAGLERRLGVPVIDPTQAAVAMAVGGVLAAGL